MTDRTDAELYRLAQANKMVRLGLVTRDEQGELVPTPALNREMDVGTIVPDQIDLDHVATKYGRR